MLKRIALILTLILAVGNICIAAEKELMHNYYYLNVKQVDDNTLEAKSKMIGDDKSTVIYTYVIDVKTKSSTQTMIEVFDSSKKKIVTCNPNFHFNYGDQNQLATMIVDEAFKEIQGEKEKI